MDANNQAIIYKIRKNLELNKDYRGVNKEVWT